MTDFNSPQALADLSAELDDADHDPAGDDAGADPPTGRPAYYAGMIATGPPPYPGHMLVSRFPSGVLLVDRPSGTAWVLDYDPSAGASGAYTCRDAAGVPLDPDGRWRAAEGPTYDVRAYDPAFDGDEAPDACPEPGCDDDSGVTA